MAANFNQVTIVGNISTDLKEIGSDDNRGIAFNVAVNGRRANVEYVDFIPVSVWGQNAEFAKNFLRKGRSVLVVGRLRSKRNDDTGVTYWSVNATDVQANDSKRPQTEVEEPSVPTQPAE